MGSGKTAVGKQLARLLDLTFYDSDVEIERRTGVDIPYIFEKEGETGFREREREVIDSLTQLQDVVLATGGGAVLLPENRERLAERGCVVYLRTGIRQQLERTRHGRSGRLLNTADPEARAARADGSARAALRVHRQRGRRHRRPPRARRRRRHSRAAAGRAPAAQLSASAGTSASTLRWASAAIRS